MKKSILCSVFSLVAVCSMAQVDPPENARRKGTWVETRYDEPGVMIVHRNGREMKVTRVPGTGEEGIPLQLRGPSEISMKWVAGPGEWPDEIMFVKQEELHDGVVLVEVGVAAAAAAATLAAMPEVLYAYPVEYTDPMFARIMPTDQVIASLSNGVDVAEISAPFGLDVVTNMIGSTTEYVLRLTNPRSFTAADAVAALIGSGLVQWAQRDCLRKGEFYATPNDNKFGNQWHLNATGQIIGTFTAPINVDVDAPSAWNTTTGGSGLNPSVIAVVDDAIETTHPDLTANISAVGAYDFFNNDINPNPDGTTDGHGTSCAGVAAAVGNNSLGVAGMAYNTTIVPVKICGNGIFPNDSTVAQGVRHAANYADIITCSWGYYNPAPVTRSAVQYALQSGAGGRGSVVYFAAGNDGGFIPHMATLGAAGTYNLRWRYTKDSANFGGLDKCFVDSIWYPNGGTEMFDAAGLVPPALPTGWTSGGSGAWISAAQSAGSRAESGTGVNWQFIESPPILDNQSVYAQVLNTGVGASAPMWYYMRVSAEPTTYVGNTATMYDYGQLEYLVPGSSTWTTANVQGGQPDILSYPAQYPETVAVGANDWTSRRSHYSQWSDALDFVAPSDGDWAGLGIETTDMTGGGGYDAGNYCQAANLSSKFGGTSSAAPLAAGIGALIRSANPWLSPAQVRNVMRASCRKLGPSPSWYSYSGILGGRDQYVGWGQVDANAALAVAANEPAVAQIAIDLKITELSPLDADCPFVEIFNNSTAVTYSLETLMLTDCETGGDETESSYVFPQGMTIPPQGILVVALGATSVGLVNELTLLMAPLGTIQLFECVPSGLVFNGPIGQMLPQAGTIPTGISLGASDNIALVVTPGMQTSYLPDVVDGMGFGMPLLTGGCIIGAAPGIMDIAATTNPFTFPSGANGTLSYQRIGTVDTEDSLVDFTAAPRTPGRIAYGSPVASASATPLASNANDLEVMPGPSTPNIVIATSLDSIFDPVVNSLPMPLGASLGADVIIYNGPAGPGIPGVDLGMLPVGPYAPGTPIYYRVWSVIPGDLYSYGTDFTATTLPTPVALPFTDSFTASLINPGLWAYTQGVSIDNGTLAGMPPSPLTPNFAQFDNAAGPNPRMDSINIDASATPNVKLTYWLAETGIGPGDPQEQPLDSLDVQILDSTLTWITITNHPAMGPSPFQPWEHVIAPAMLHPDLRVRFVSKSMIDYYIPSIDLDHWFIDDVSVEEFPVLSGFQWQSIPAQLSSGIPFDVHLSALSSMGGVFTEYMGNAALTLYATNGALSTAVSPNPATGFTSGVWSNSITIAGEDALHVVLVADDSGITGTSSVFKVYDDIDIDSMLDSWEFGWFGAINIASNPPATDWDNDLFTDYSEFIAGTNPTNPASLLQLIIPIVDPGVSNILHWSSVANRVYDVWRSTNLVTGGWVMISASNMPAIPPTNIWVDTSSPSNRAFYKVKVKRK